jgi:hypothetical protein
MTAIKNKISLTNEAWADSYVCIDCGRNTFPSCPPRELAEIILKRDGEVLLQVTDECEVYFVRKSVWRKAGLKPFGGCLRIGCLEKRVGRRLKPKDLSVSSGSACQSPSGCRFTTRARLRIMNRPAGFSATATLNAARARASVRRN